MYGTLGFGFIDDTNLITWGDSAAENCRQLETAYDYYTEWANRHGATFAPKKYQLMHFIRRRRHAAADLASAVRIAGCETAPEKTSMRILGIWVDPKL